MQVAKTLAPKGCALWLGCPNLGALLTFINGFYLFQDFLKKQGFRDALMKVN